jgi:hypothetical protein
MLFSFIGGGGLITPLSDAEATPTVYIASTALQSYYTSLAASSPSSVNTQNGAAITAACTGVTTCYVAQYPLARNRFFRNYAAGFRIRRFYFNEDDNAYIFPATFDVTIGQNDYVTGGQLHREVAHFGGSTPLPGSLSALAGVYVYAYADMELSRSNIPNQQFLLVPASPTITPASANVAAVQVGQPDRDRYRFGIAYDLPTLIKKLSPAK